MEIYNLDDTVLIAFNYLVDTIRVNPITVAGLLAGLKLIAKKTKSTKDDKIYTMLVNLFNKMLFVCGKK